MRRARTNNPTQTQDSVPEGQPKNLRASAVNRRSSALKRRGGWGGRRPGAGAPRGNLNGFKHGRRSRQLAVAAAVLAANPKLRETLLTIGRRAGVEQAKAEEVAIRWFVGGITKGIKVENEEQARDLTNLLREMEK
jgi:hypothetical protein